MTRLWGLAVVFSPITQFSKKEMLVHKFFIYYVLFSIWRLPSILDWALSLRG